MKSYWAWWKVGKNKEFGLNELKQLTFYCSRTYLLQLGWSFIRNPRQILTEILTIMSAASDPKSLWSSNTPTTILFCFFPHIRFLKRICLLWKPFHYISFQTCFAQSTAFVTGNPCLFLVNVAWFYLVAYQPLGVI